MNLGTSPLGSSRDLDLLLAGGSVVGLDDAALLARVVGGSGSAADAALDALIRRHGGLVARVCAGILGDPHAAEDATQAVFLVLIRKARSIRDPDRLASWLYGVALRTAREARAETARYRRRHHHLEPDPHESTMIDPTPDPSATSSRLEQAEILHRAIARLPQRYLDPIVLCDLAGLTHAEAAAQLGCPVATVSIRAQRAKAKLRATLSRHRLDFETTMLPTLAATAVPRTLAASASAYRLARRVGWTLGAAKWQAAAIVVLVAAATAVGAHASSRQDPAPNPNPPTVPAGSATDPQVPAEPNTPKPPEPQRPAPAELQIPPVAEAPPRFEVGLPTIRTVTDYEIYGGRVAASRSVVVRSRVDKVVERVEVADGDLVKEGQVLFKLAGASDKADEEQLQDKQKELIVARDRAEQIAEASRHSGDPAERRAKDKVAAIAKSLQELQDSVKYNQKLQDSLFSVGSPFAGQIAEISVDAGEAVEAGKTPLATIIAVDPIRVNFQVDEQSYVRIQRWLRSKPGMTHLPVQVALADDNEFTHPGRVLFRAMQFNPELKTCTLHAELPNPDGALIPGLSARVRVEYGDPHAALLVPERALTIGIPFQGGYSSIRTVDGDEVAHDTPIVVGQNFAGFRQVLRGLDPKARVILDARFPELRDGGPIGHLLHPFAEPPR